MGAALQRAVRGSAVSSGTHPTLSEVTCGQCSATAASEASVTNLQPKRLSCGQRRGAPLVEARCVSSGVAYLFQLWARHQHRKKTLIGQGCRVSPQIEDGKGWKYGGVHGGMPVGRDLASSYELRKGYIRQDRRKRVLLPHGRRWILLHTWEV